MVAEIKPSGCQSKNGNIKTKQASLTWNVADIATSTATILLFDEANDALVNMKTTGTYTFDVREGQPLRFIFKKKGDFKPGITELGKAYPNPFAQSLAIPVYLLDANSSVHVNIYDGLGRTVTSLNQTFIAAGYNEIKWDGSIGSNSFASDGLLFYKVIVNGKAGELKRLFKQSE